MNRPVIAEVKSLYKAYGKEKPPVYAVRDVSLQIREGEILGVVGESGCGKSTLGKLMLRLLKPSAGQILFEGQDISGLSFNRLRPIRRNMQMIFQGSANAFNPYLTVQQILKEPLHNYAYGTKAEQEERMKEMLQAVDLAPSYLDRYSRELSGGQRQRVGIARALILDPKFVICDEAVSSIDYALKNQVLRILYHLKQDKNFTYMFISHDMSAIRAVCDRIAVMYMGNLVEILPTADSPALHPYTKALMAATLAADPTNRQETKLLFKTGVNPVPPEQGCPFARRCLYAKESCLINRPELKEYEAGHFSACDCTE